MARVAAAMSGADFRHRHGGGWFSASPTCVPDTAWARMAVNGQAVADEHIVRQLRQPALSDLKPREPWVPLP